VLQAGGDVTQGFVNVLPRLLPLLDGLGPRLEGSAAAFLDVGTGVGKLAIGMARKWPALRVVGLDVWGPSLALARKNVTDGGLQDRIELREQPGEQLPEERAFDLAWIPAPFVPPHALGRLVAQVDRGAQAGRVAPVCRGQAGRGLEGSCARLPRGLFGGEPSTQQQIEGLLSEKGLSEVRTLPGPPHDFKMVVAGRRAA
jgi:SAM-dependent methyltransferase